MTAQTGQVWRTVALMLMSAVLGAALLGGGLIWLKANDPNLKATPIASSSPGMDAVEAFRCKAGLVKTIQIRGVEDGFARGNLEPATIRPALMSRPYFKDLASRQITTLRARDFDEFGSMKVLIDHFDVPKNVVSGTLYLRFRTREGDTNDGILMGDYLDGSPGRPFSEGLGFGLRARGVGKATPLADGSSLAILNLDGPEGIIPSSETTSPGIIDFLNQPQRKGAIDVRIGNDTALDFIALGLCSEPQTSKGTTFSEYSTKPLGQNVSFLSCSIDSVAAMCDPFVGDTPCGTALPVACYQLGQRAMTPTIAAAKYDQNYYVGGEVRLSTPSAGEKFRNVSDVSAFCAASFGDGWRVLSYHEGGGGAVLSQSRIPSGIRAWVDVRDQPWGNCWGRPKPSVP
jgi:hypothetical protein